MIQLLNGEFPPNNDEYCVATENNSISCCRSVQLKRLDENAEVAVLCQSISTYLSTLNVENLDQLSQQIFEDVTLWLTKLFRWA